MERRESILVVDDDVEMLRILTRSLELEGYDVATAADGRSALAILKAGKPDLVILDIVMPEIDGFQVLDIMRQQSNVPVIMLTAKTEVDSVRDAMALGADDYVKKPFHIGVLVARVRAKLRRTRVGLQ